MACYEVTPLTKPEYDELREELYRVVSLPPDELVAIVEDAQEVIVRSVLRAMSQAESASPVEGITQVELWVVYDVLDIAAQGPIMQGTVQVSMDSHAYADLVSRFGLGSDPLAAFAGPDAPRVLSAAAGQELIGTSSPGIFAYLVIGRPED